MRKQKVALLSIYSNTFLVVLKFAVGFFMGSVSVISEGIHSLLDLMAAIIANYSVRRSDIPADKDHPYGHGKFENYAGVIEAILIVVAAVIIIYEATKKLIEAAPVEFLYAGIIVMGISAVVNMILSRKLYRVGIEEDSIALQADGLHLKTDVITSLGVFVGLILINFTGLTILDPIVALLVAVIIIKASYDLTREASKGLVDRRLPEKEELEIKTILAKHSKMFVGFHDLRTRKSGAHRFVDLHLVMRYDMKLEEASDVAEHIEKEIEERIKNTRVMVKVESCDPEDLDFKRIDLTRLNGH